MLLTCARALTRQRVRLATPTAHLRWRPQFGMPLEAYETTSVNGYDIPVVLVRMWATLRQNGGLAEEGIFRLAPDKHACAELHESLCSDPDALGRLGPQTDFHVLANLIKIWFRELPMRLLADVTAAQVSKCESGEECMALVQSFDRPRQGLLLWLLELMADVADRGDDNRMNERAIAIVVVPNLYGSLEDDILPVNPMAALEFTQGMAKFITELLLYFMHLRKLVRSSITEERVPPAGPPEGATSADPPKLRSSESVLQI